MSRRTLLFSLLAATLLIAGGWWFARHLERVPVSSYRPPGMEALHDRYLALERFMMRMGRPVTRTGDPRALQVLKPGGVLILDRHRRALMTKAKLKELFAWVGNGGYLIIIPEYSGEPDPVLASLHVRWARDADRTKPCNCGNSKNLPPGKARSASAPVAAAPRPVPATVRVASAPAAASMPASAPAQATEDDTGEDDTEDDDTSAANLAAAPKTITAFIPGYRKPLLIGMQSPGLTNVDVAPAWRVARDARSDWLLHYRYGLGNISVIVNLDQILSNGTIAEFDHAEFFWRLLQHYQPAGPLTLVTHLPVPDLFDWLTGTAWMASASAAVLIALWLWRVAPRFGGAQPDSPPSRRELQEHLSAVGRFVWRTEGLARWLEVARASFRERLAMRHPAIASMHHAEQAAALAHVAPLPVETILAALTGSPRSTSEFTAMLRTLKTLKQHL